MSNSCIYIYSRMDHNLHKVLSNLYAFSRLFRAGIRPHLRRCSSMTTRALCPRWKPLAQDFDEVASKGAACLLYERPARLWSDH